MTPASPPADRGPQGSGFADQIVTFTGRLGSIGRQEAQALVRRLGGETAGEVTGRTTMLVVGTERVADGKSAKLKRAEELNAAEPGRVRILSEDEFCRLGGLQTSTALRERYYSLRRLRGLYPLVHEPRLRALHTCGLIRAVERTNTDAYYALADVGVIKQINDELRQGRSFRAAVRERLAARAGQLALDFSAARGDARPAKVVALRRRATTKITSRAGQPVRLRPDNPQASQAARYFLEGAECDEGNDADLERARRSLPQGAAARSRDGPRHREPRQHPLCAGRAGRGRRRSTCGRWGLDADCFEAHFNLGNIHHDLGRFEDAVAWYRDALRLNPSYADAHFYLAVTLEKMDRPDRLEGALAGLPAPGARRRVGGPGEAVQRLTDRVAGWVRGRVVRGSSAAKRACCRAPRRILKNVQSGAPGLGVEAVRPRRRAARPGCVQWGDPPLSGFARQRQVANRLSVAAFVNLGLRPKPPPAWPRGRLR